MSETEPEYSTYTYEELNDVINHIDMEAYPEKVSKINEEIKNRRQGIPPNKSSRYNKTQKTKTKTKTKTNKPNKLTRYSVLAIWSITVLLAIYYGKLPSRNGVITFEEEPGFFISLMIVHICVGIYFYRNRDDT